MLTADYGPVKTSQKPYNKQLLNFEGLVLTEKSQTSALWY